MSPQNKNDVQQPKGPLHNPHLGETIWFVKTAAETHGALLEMEAVYAPNQTWKQGVAHFHPEQHESFKVLEGMISVRQDGRESTYVAGEEFEIPRGVVHNMRNLSNQPVRVRWQVRPALQTQEFFETTFGLAEDGLTNEAGIPNILQLAVWMRDYRTMFVLSEPPLVVQRVLFGGLAVLGKLLGYRSRYEKYSGPVDRTQIHKAEVSA